MKKQNVRTISLIVCTFTYLLVGAAVFDALESETEKRRWEALQDAEDMIIRKYNISQEDFKVMETVVLKSESHKAGQQWKFTGAFYYATTVLTTIGYGHSTPSTVGGKLFTMCYAIVGIPLGLVMFQSIGERVNRLSSYVIKAVRSSLRCKRTVASEVDLICVVTTLSSLTIAGGAAAFSKFEGWSYFDSVYYCFITLTTIGFGDMVALQRDNALNRKPEYVMFALIFILFGLAIVAASLNLLVLRFVTMNTEDERRDEAQAMQALQVAVKLEGDVITSNGSILSGYEGHDGQSLNGSNTSSMCSCHCICLNGNRHKKSSNLEKNNDAENQYKLRQSPTHIRHLLPEVVPMQDLNYDYDTQSLHTLADRGTMDSSYMGVDMADMGDTGSMELRPHTLLKRNVSLLSIRI
uniref:Acid-sensitive two pore domain K+ channel dTASK-6 n=1 Tax=Drosophila melanogaster TaxID=7227 RepID=Q9VFS9_DROME|nr:TWIK-related acid-sensitive K[+] channel 6, isoform F [Drosophila melanogaster]NP_650300.2 TWIK-related acid-sensitive K[+] channel 6, isoform C [Drosophila melanogaster]AAF54970.2 TWIK-related acid-sensitive K[+] channel 6, isoform C [Drosophila melanogaster]AGB95923.1 TWIK-related acid-sensitive K[+] channel 6, isoform F [Drosophila melanogaster]CAI72672.1 acid-sensitive two pore domain K+ channel dTASK-6 [Drosophila melanogaster]|eukprot:NP_001262541.1 TWIK-related acid-sensitive K[+] channel 6, isoform F [Drosophila melanogaster]